MSTTWQTPISSFETNRRRVGALKSLGVVSVGDALTYYPFRVTEPVPARALREAKIGEKMAFAAHVRGVRVFPMARRGFRLIADVDDGDFARSRHMDASMASLVFFSYRKSYVDWIQRKLHEGALLVVAGEPSVYNDRLQFTHPDILTVDPAGEQLRSRSSEEAAEWDDGFGTEQPAAVPQSPTMPNLKYDAASVPEAMRHVCRPRPVYHANSRISSEHIHESIEKCMDRLCGDEYAAAQAARALHGADASDAQHGEFDAPQADRQDGSACRRHSRHHAGSVSYGTWADAPSRSVHGDSRSAKPRRFQQGVAYTALRGSAHLPNCAGAVSRFVA